MSAQRGINDSIRTGVYVEGLDTFPMIILREAYIYDKMPKWLAKQLREKRRRDELKNRLRHNVYVTYPYAIAASYILQDVDSVLNSMHSRVAKKQFKERKEKELNKRFKNELQELTIQQGQVLVKLIARQTGKPCYEIVRELKGGFNATLWQGVALLFSNNLKNSYDPDYEDVDIEIIVREIEASGRFERVK